MAAQRSILVLGSGPAGLSAGLWLKNLGLAPLVLEAADHPGGLQNLNFLANDWVLGQRDQTGPQLAAHFVAHALEAGVPLLVGCRPTRIEGSFGAFAARLREEGGGERSVSCAAVLLATGTRYRAAEVLRDVEGLSAIPAGRLVYGPWAFAEVDRLANSRLLIIGGGDNAFENARLALERGAVVTLALRSAPRAQKVLLDSVLSHERCRVLQPSLLTALEERPDGLHAVFSVAGAAQTVVVDRLHVLAGYEPNSRLIADVFAPELASAIALDAAGYVRSDAGGRTGAPGVYVAGDVCNPLFPSVVSAIAQGALAAKTIEIDLRQL